MIRYVIKSERLKMRRTQEKLLKKQKTLVKNYSSVSAEKRFVHITNILGYLFSVIGGMKFSIAARSLG